MLCSEASPSTEELRECCRTCIFSETTRPEIGSGTGPMAFDDDSIRRPSNWIFLCHFHVGLPRSVSYANKERVLSLKMNEIRIPNGWMPSSLSSTSFKKKVNTNMKPYGTSKTCRRNHEVPFSFSLGPQKPEHR